MQNREPGIDLIRCLGLLFVTGVHSFVYNGFYDEPQTGLLIFGADCFRWLFFSCNGIFMLMTGYLKSDKPFNAGYYRGLLPILTGYLLTCVISFPVRQFLLGDVHTFSAWVEKMMGFDNYAWYVEMYIGLLLISPVFNIAISALKEKKQLLWLAGIMLVMTALPSVTTETLLPEHWQGVYPLTYYVLGAVIKRFYPKTNPFAALGVAALTVMWLGYASVRSTDSVFDDGFPQGYGGFFVTMTVVAVFLAFYRVKPGPRISRFLSFISGGVFEGYILSRLFDVWCYDLVPSWHTPAMYPLVFLCITLPICVVSLFAGKAVHSLALLILRPVYPKRRPPAPGSDAAPSALPVPAGPAEGSAAGL